MPTNKIVLRSTEEFMADYSPVYQPIYPLFLGANAQQHAMEVGSATYKRVNTVGDIRSKHITPKDTELRQVAVSEGSKTFKKYFFANQYVNSTLQDRQGAEEVISQVLDEHHIQMDELFVMGEGTTAGTQVNNALYLSSDPNYTLENSVEIAKTNRLYDMHGKVVTTAQKAKRVAGKKIIFFYGEGVLPLFNGLYDTAVKGWKAVLSEVLGPEFDFVELPSDVTPAGANGWIIANQDRVKLHYTKLPGLLDQGVNSEKMYLWFNFLMGSCMLEVLAKDAVIRQPATLEA